MERPCSLTAICERKQAQARKQKLTGILVVIVQGEGDKNHKPAERNYS